MTANTGVVLGILLTVTDGLKPGILLCVFLCVERISSLLIFLPPHLSVYSPQARHLQHDTC